MTLAPPQAEAGKSQKNHRSDIAYGVVGARRQTDRGQLAVAAGHATRQAALSRAGQPRVAKSPCSAPRGKV